MRYPPALLASFAAVLLAGGADAQTATATKTTTTRHYDCSKAGNANKAACKGAIPAASSAPAPAPASAATVATRTVTTHSVHTTTAQATNAAGPNGATALCNDGSYSHSAHHSGSCSRHKGVKQFY